MFVFTISGKKQEHGRTRTSLFPFFFLKNMKHFFNTLTKHETCLKLVFILKKTRTGENKMSRTKTGFNSEKIGFNSKKNWF